MQIENMTTEERCTLNKIESLLAAQAALDFLYHSHDDSRGLDLATHCEADAHALWRGLGYADMPTWELARTVSAIVAE